MEEIEVAFRPNPGPQTEFFSANEQEVLFGGAAGGGKSFAMLADPLRYLAHPHNSALMLRRTTEEMRELRWKSQELYPKAIPGIKWSERNQTWTSPNGGRLWMSYLDNDNDVLRYQGQAYNWIGFDELTQWPTPFAWDYLRSRLRTTSKELPLYMRATTNPGNVGGWWVKKMFVDPAPPNTSFPATDQETGEIITFPMTNTKGRPHPKAGEPVFYRRFIPANLYDNPFLFDDGNYEANLMALPEYQRKQLLEGSWDVIEGAAFPEWNRHVHVVEPFRIPAQWRRFRACDYGYSSFSAVVWFAVHPSGQLIVYRDLEISKVTGWDLADMIYEIETDNFDNVSYGVLDSSVWHEKGNRGPSIGDQMQRHNLRWRPSDRTKGARVAGKNELHRLLRVDEFIGEPGVVFFSNAVHCIAQLPVIPLDKNNPEDVDTKARDHVYDALRYGVMSRPRPTPMYGQGPLANRVASTPRYEPADKVLGY